MKISKKTISVLIAVLILVLMQTAVFAAGEKLVVTTSDQTGSADTIYVVGNPSAYPVEYYNESTKAYEGIMPMALERIAEETGLRFTYIDGGLKDVRERAAANGQAEIISGVSSKDEGIINGLKSTGKILFSAENGEEEYFFGYTDASTDSLAGIIENAASRLSSEDFLGYSITAASKYKPSAVSQNFLIPAAVAAAALLIAVIVLAVKLRRAESAPAIAAEVDIEHVNALSPQAFKDRYDALVTSDTCAIYNIFYFSFDTELVAQKYGVAFMERQLKYAEEILEEIITKDEFICESSSGIVAACPCGSKDNAEKWVRKVLDALNGALEKGNIAYFRAGIFSLGQNAIDFESVLRNVKQGFRAALDSNRDYLFCDKAMLNKLNDMVQISNDISGAFENREIKLYLQPIIRFTGEVVGAEALCRWVHPKRGLMHPGMFLDAFTETGNITKLDLYIFDEVCRLLEDWQKRGLNGFITCNFSRVTIDSATFAQDIISIASKYDFDYGHLIVEIIEDFMETNKKQALENIQMVKDAGFLIGLDDVGSGTTSFSDLLNYPIDLFKIDKSILLQAKTPKGRDLLQAMINFAFSLKMSPLCEGIETQEDMELLMSMGIKFLQGYYFYRPMPVAEVEKLF